MVLRAQAVAWALALHWREIHLHQDAWVCLSVGICGPGDRTSLGSVVLLTMWVVTLSLEQACTPGPAQLNAMIHGCTCVMWTKSGSLHWKNMRSQQQHS